MHYAPIVTLSNLWILHLVSLLSARFSLEASVALNLFQYGPVCLLLLTVLWKLYAAALSDISYSNVYLDKFDINFRHLITITKISIQFDTLRLSFKLFKIGRYHRRLAVQTTAWWGLWAKSDGGTRLLHHQGEAVPPQQLWEGRRCPVSSTFCVSSGLVLSCRVS